MGFTFRKRTKDGVNVSYSSRGLRISKTVKSGNASFNVGTYFGGTMGGKTTGRVTAGKDGFQYRKDFTMGGKTNGKDPLPSLTKTFDTTYVEDGFEPRSPFISLFGIVLALLPFFGIYFFMEFGTYLERIYKDTELSIFMFLNGFLFYSTFIPKYLFAKEYGATLLQSNRFYLVIVTILFLFVSLYMTAHIIYIVKLFL